MASPKKYVPMTHEQAIGYIIEKRPGVGGIMPDALLSLLYAEVLKLHERLDEIENQAQEMMSPDKMMEMAQGFLGGGMKF